MITLLQWRSQEFVMEVVMAGGWGWSPQLP